MVTGSEFGGPSRHVLALLDHVTGRGHTAALVSAPEPRLMRAARDLGVAVFANPHFIRPVRPLTDLRALGPVLRAIRAFRPDLVSAHSTKAGFAARLCGAFRVPVIFTAHGWAFTEGHGQAARRILAGAERLAARLTARIICVSEHDRQLALEFRVAPPEKLVVVHNGIAGGAFPHHARPGRATPVITMVGRLVPQKDPLGLLEACLRLRGPFRLRLVGDGALRPDVEGMIRSEPRLREAVSLLGEREDVPEVLATSDIFVLPSRWEGLPRAIIEAMLAGLPVVATDVGGSAELVEAGATGFLVEPRSPDALADALQRLRDDPMLRRKMGEAGRRRALERFEVRKMQESTFMVYLGVTGVERSP